MAADERLNRKQIGALGEEMACQALERRGYTIIERNWRCPIGEIDIVAKDGDCWAFVEVKTRHGRGMGLPEEAVTSTKADRLSELAQTYLTTADAGLVDWRIDLVAIELDRHHSVQRLRVIPGIGVD